MYEKQFITMGNRIRLRRKEIGLTQNKLAELIDTSNNHISAIENGRERPSIEKFIAICEVLKTTPDFFLMGILHSGNVPQNIIDGLVLCSASDLELIGQIVEFMVARNQNFWSENNTI